jgi:hypothetical protein
MLTDQLPAVTEKVFLARVIECARLFRWKAYHTHDSRYSAAGFPDLVLVRERVVFAELKTDRGVISPAQAEWLAKLRRAGAEVHLWRPADWREIERVLKPEGV